MKKLIPVIVVIVIVLIGIVIYFKVTDNNTSKTTNTKVSEEKTITPISERRIQKLCRFVLVMRIIQLYMS